MTRPKIDYTKQRFLPASPQAAIAIPLASLGLDALYEALAGGADDKTRRGMAGLIARVGRKYTSEARQEAARIEAGLEPLPPIPAYMIR